MLTFPIQNVKLRIKLKAVLSVTFKFLPQIKFFGSISESVVQGHCMLRIIAVFLRATTQRDF